MANQMAQEELLLDIRVAEASSLYKFYLIQEKKILGAAAVILFLTAWELVGNTLQLINPMELRFQGCCRLLPLIGLFVHAQFLWSLTFA